MLSVSLMLLGSALPSLVVGADASWSISFWSGIHCSGEETGTMSGGEEESGRGDIFCYDIPDVGFSAALDFYASSASMGYRVQLHTQHNCLDNEGRGFEGRPNAPICLQLSDTPGAVAYSVTKDTKKRDVDQDRSLVTIEQAWNETEGGMSINPRGIDSFLLTGIIGVGGFAITAAEYCPRLVDPDKRNLQGYTPCAVSSTFAVVTAFLTGFGSSGDESKKDQDTSKRSLFENVAFSHLDASSILPGYHITMSRQPSEVDEDGNEWDRIIMNMVHQETGFHSQAEWAKHNETGRNMISSPAYHASDIETRSSNFYAIYAWSRESESIFDGRSTSHDEVNQLTADLWNYGRRNDKGEYCADFVVQNDRANTGIFTITDGVFAPDFSKCEG